MAAIAVSSRGQNSLTLYMSELNQTTGYQEILITVNGQTSPNLRKNSGINSTSNSYTWTGLTCGRSYYVTGYLRSNGGSTANPFATIDTGNCPLPPQEAGTPSSVSVTASTQTKGRVTVYWGSAPYASYYVATIRTSGGSYVTDSGYTSGYSAIIDYLQEGTYYNVTVTAYNASYSTGGSRSGSFLTHTFTPPKPGNVSSLSATASPTVVGRVGVSWSHASGASYYTITVRDTYGSYIMSDTTTNSSYTVTGLGEYKYYTFTIISYNDGGSSSGVATSVTTPDLTPPSLYSVVGSGAGGMSMTFNASDSSSGMRSQSTYYTEISNAGGTSYGQGAYSTNKFRTFTTNGQGGNFVQNSYYNMRVTAYDMKDNGSQATVNVQYKSARPTDWTAHTTKTRGQPVNVTATEWNSFCTRVSEFSVYKTGSAFSFTNVIRGNAITADQVNLIRTKIASMGAAVPTAATKNNELTAAYFNGLVTSLNSIT